MRPSYYLIFKPTEMKKLIILTLFLWGISASAQNKSEIIRYQIKSKTEYSTNYEEGQKEAVMDEKYTYDNRGNILLEVNYDSEGELKEKIRYSYDAQGNKIQAEYYNNKEKLIKKITYTYNDKGLKTSKTEYDAQGNIMVKKTYEYEF